MKNIIVPHTTMNAIIMSGPNNGIGQYSCDHHIMAHLHLREMCMNPERLALIYRIRGTSLRRAAGRKYWVSLKSAAS
jgi:hypothetical protein